jgi:hypothetical protein
MKTKVWVTNGDLGSDNNWAFEYNIQSWQGIKALRGWVAMMGLKTGKTAWVEIWLQSGERKKVFIG